MDINTLIKQLVHYQHRYGNMEIELGTEQNGYADIEEVYYESDEETVVIQAREGF